VPHKVAPACDRHSPLRFCGLCPQSALHLPFQKPAPFRFGRTVTANRILLTSDFGDPDKAHFFVCRCRQQRRRGDRHKAHHQEGIPHCGRTPECPRLPDSFRASCDGPEARVRPLLRLTGFIAPCKRNAKPAHWGRIRKASVCPELIQHVPQWSAVWTFLSVSIISAHFLAPVILNGGPKQLRCRHQSSIASDSVN
jgi:hypothetical protein